MNPEKYNRNTQGKGATWKDGVMKAAGDYCAGVAEALGISVGQCQASKAGRNYQAGIQAASAADYDRGVAGKGQKWFDRYRRAYGG
jgi:2-hydroxychromene-2-carboxylate isomerase